jgi:hypothetical protein
MNSKQILAEINNKIIFLYHRQGGEIVDHLSHLEELKILKDKYLAAVEEEKADDAFVTGKRYHITSKCDCDPFDFGNYIAARTAHNSFTFISLKNGNRLIDPIAEFEFKKSSSRFKEYTFTEIS